MPQTVCLIAAIKWNSREAEQDLAIKYFQQYVSVWGAIIMQARQMGSSGASKPYDGMRNSSLALRKDTAFLF